MHELRHPHPEALRAAAEMEAIGTERRELRVKLADRIERLPGAVLDREAGRHAQSGSKPAGSTQGSQTRSAAMREKRLADRRR